MKDDTDLKSAYAIKDVEETKTLYAAWAETYDVDFVDAQGYQSPREVVRHFAEAGGVGPILDVGAGTGVVGEGLRAAGLGPVDGLDLSPEMLAIAETKGVYRQLIEADVTKPLPVSGYGGIVSAGTFTLGHVGPEGLDALLAAAQPGCLFVISVNAVHFEVAAFGAYLAKLDTTICDLRIGEFRLYNDRADLPHRHDLGRMLIFRKA